MAADRPLPARVTRPSREALGRVAELFIEAARRWNAAQTESRAPAIRDARPPKAGKEQLRGPSRTRAAQLVGYPPTADAAATPPCPPVGRRLALLLDGTQPKTVPLVVWPHRTIACRGNCGQALNGRGLVIMLGGVPRCLPCALKVAHRHRLSPEEPAGRAAA